MTPRGRGDIRAAVRRRKFHARPVSAYISSLSLA